MIHRKNNHRHIVKQCTNFMQNRCRFNTEFCWYKHEVEAMESDDCIEEESNSVFQNAKEKEKTK